MAELSPCSPIVRSAARTRPAPIGVWFQSYAQAVVIETSGKPWLSRWLRIIATRPSAGTSLTTRMSIVAVAASGRRKVLLPGPV